MRSGTRLLLSIAAVAWPAAAGALPYAYISNFGANTVSMIDTSTDSVAGTMSVGYSPTDVALSPDGTRAYVVLSYYTLSVIDAALNAVVATVDVGYSPRAVAVHPDGTRAYVAGY